MTGNIVSLMPPKRRPKPNSTEDHRNRALDVLSEFEEFCHDTMPLLREAIAKRWTREEIENHPRIQALMVARQVMIGLCDNDSGKALAAIKDLRDRKEGRAVERREVKTRIEEAGDDALDARLKTLLGQDASAADPKKH